MDNYQELIGQVSKQLKPRYETSLKEGLSPDAAYMNIYPHVLRLVANKLGVSEEKTEFESRLILQRIIQTITA